jgi:hypothetical protein
MSPTTSTPTRTDRLLRLALRLDAVASGATGVGLAALGWALDDVLGVPVALTLPLGLFLTGFAGWLWYLAGRPRIGAGAVRAVIALNVVWVLDSVALVAAGWAPLTALGTAYVLAQAAAVLLFADLQFVGLRRVRQAAAG